METKLAYLVVGLRVAKFFECAIAIGAWAVVFVVLTRVWDCVHAEEIAWTVGIITFIGWLADGGLFVSYG